ncbi:MAG: M15 family metallopeptidase [Actinomycetota bacterium]
MARRTLAGLIAVLIAGGAAAVVAGPLEQLDWITRTVPDEAFVDRHHNYPPKPSGAAGLTRVFGRPCNADANANTFLFLADDDGRGYPVNYHRLLGGTASSNLDNDIPGHIRSDGLQSKILSGIWGYACRYKRNGTDWSVHAWGVAVDINSRYEVPGTSCRTVPAALGHIWTQHGWTWGASWRDCMHFQYASNY